MLPPCFEHISFNYRIVPLRPVAYPTTIHVYDQDQTLESPHRIDAVHPNPRPSFFSIPNLEISSAMFRTSSSELEICYPLSLRYPG